MLFSLLSADATIEVIKKAKSLPSIAVEDATKDYDDAFRLGFFKSIIADLNVLSIFNVDRHHRLVNFNNEIDPADAHMNYVLKYRMQEQDSGALLIEFKLFQQKQLVFSKSYKIARKDIYMFVSHAIAYDINKFMGEPSIAWMKRKVVFSRMVNAKRSEIVIADYTLSYQHTIISGGFNIFPKWANQAQTAIYYTSLDKKKPTLYRVDLRTGKLEKIMASDGMMICSDVSRDGNTLLLTMARNGQPDIYLYNVQTKKLRQETYYKGIDVNAQFMDNNRIVFVSNRLGYPNIFSKKIGSRAVEQMVYYGKSNAACSAYGNYVVYKARESSNAFAKNTFNLHLISTKTDFIRRLTATGVNEYPRFSKDGDAILFIKNFKKQSAIGIIRLNYNKNYLFPLHYGKVQSMDW